MNQDNREITGGLSAVIGAELLVVIAIICGAAIGVNVGAVTSAIADLIGG